LALLFPIQLCDHEDNGNFTLCLTFWLDRLVGGRKIYGLLRNVMSQFAARDFGFFRISGTMFLKKTYR
jgi:hypothetical protein